MTRRSPLLHFVEIERPPCPKCKARDDAHANRTSNAREVELATFGMAAICNALLRPSPPMKENPP